MKYFKPQIILLVVLIILGSFPGIYANTVQHDNNAMGIGKINDVSTNGTQTIYVAKNGTDRNDGLTPEKPKRNIVNAINAANSGDTIKVGPGTYNDNLQIDKDLILIGDTQNNTILDGHEQTRVPCIYICVRSVTVTITNFTIKNGNTQDHYAYLDGGGIHNDGTLTLENVTITNNTSSYGGGIHNGGTMTIRGVTITNNTATPGGGINNYGTLTLEDSIIMNNTAEWGGGIYNGGPMTLNRVIIKNNNATDHGGGITNGNLLTVENSTIMNNVAAHEGGGIYNRGTLTGEDSTIMNNTASTEGGGIYNHYFMYLYGMSITNNRANNGKKGNNGGGIMNYSHAYIDDLTRITDNLPNNFEGTPLIPA